VQPHLIKPLISQPVALDVAFIPEKQYDYRTSPSPSVRSFLAEMPTGIWWGCDLLAGAGGRGQPVHGGAVGHPTLCFTPVPLASPRQRDHEGDQAARALGRSPVLQQHNASL